MKSISRDHFDFDNRIATRSAIELLRLSVLLLVVDFLAKLLLVSAGLLQANLGNSDYHTWIATTGISAVGIMVYLFTTWRLGFLSGLGQCNNSAKIYFISALILGLIFWNHQDISFDGTWYHLHRLIYQGFISDISGSNLGINPTVGLSYPMLTGNQRAIFMMMLPGSSIYSGIGVNIGMYFASVYFWDKYAVVLPRALRWIVPALCPIALSQLMTYYVDGFISSYLSISLLVLISLSANISYLAMSRFDSDISESDEILPLMKIAIVALIQSGLVLAMLKYTFPVFLVTLFLPLIFAVFQIYKAGRDKLLKVIKILFISFATRLWSLWAFSMLLVVANPYYNLLAGLAGIGTDPNFNLEYLRGWARSTSELVKKREGNLPYYLQSISRLYFTWIPVDKEGLANEAVNLSSVLRQFARGSWGYGLFHPIIVWLSTILSVFSLVLLVRIPRSQLVQSYDQFKSAAYAWYHVCSFAFLMTVFVSIIYPMSSNPRFSPQLHILSTMVIISAFNASRLGFFQGYLGHEFSRRIRLTMYYVLAICLSILMINSLLGVSLQFWRSQVILENFRNETTQMRLSLQKLGEGSTLLIKTSDHSHDAALKLKLNGINGKDIEIVNGKECESLLWFPSDLSKRVSPRFQYCFAIPSKAGS